MGMPEARVFFEPQNTATISSWVSKPKARETLRVNHSMGKRKTAAPSRACASSTGPCLDHRPSATESLNAAQTISTITPRSKTVV